MKTMINESETNSSLIMLILIFCVSLVFMSMVWYNFPQLEEHEKEHIKLPKNMEDAKHLGQVLSRYKEKYYFTVFLGYLITYIFLQSFAIPGSIFLSILSGFLYSFPLALFLVCFCSAIGATLCYLLSQLMGRRLVLKYFPEKVLQWQQHVQNQKRHLLNYIIFLRITPFLPNWFINITSPIIDVPLKPFFFGTFLGVAPPSFIAIQAGKTLNKLTSSKDMLSWSSISLLILFSILSVVPIVFKSKLESKFK